MVKVLIFGATGMVGSHVLKNCLANQKITKITIVVRKKAPVTSKKVTQIIHHDFGTISQIKNKLKNNDICFYCIGVYQNTVPKDIFIKITYDYLRNIAQAVASKGLTFCLFSAQGANPNSKILFAKWKGKAEHALQSLPFKKIYIFRPGYISPRSKRKSPTIYEPLFEPIFPLLNLLVPNYCTTAENLAKAMVTTAVNGSNKLIFENKDIRIASQS